MVAAVGVSLFIEFDVVDLVRFVLHRTALRLAVVAESVLAWLDDHPSLQLLGARALLDLRDGEAVFLEVEFQLVDYRHFWLLHALDHFF